METIKTLVVDDEPLALDLVRGYVEQTPFLQLVSSCSNAKDAFEAIESSDVQLVFLDVQMPGMSGLSLAKALNTNDAPKIIFTTAYSEYALEGFKLDAVDYLLKPFDFDEFMKAATKARRIIELENKEQEQQPDTADQPDVDYFFVKSEYKLIRIDIPKIVYIEGLKDYIKIYLDGEPKPVLTLYSLKVMDARLSKRGFMRIHRSYIINLEFVRGVERNLILMPTTKLPMGDGYRQQFMDVIGRRTL